MNFNQYQTAIILLSLLLIALIMIRAKSKNQSATKNTEIDSDVDFDIDSEIESANKIQKIQIERANRILKTIRSNSKTLTFESIYRSMPRYTREAIIDGLDYLIKTGEIIEEQDPTSSNNTKFIYKLSNNQTKEHYFNTDAVKTSNATGIHLDMDLIIQQRTQKK